MKTILSPLRKLKKSQKGFTLVELMVVIAIISILVVIVVVAINPVRLINDARDSKNRSNLNAIKAAMQLYYNDCKTYPAATVMEGNGSTTGLLHVSPPSAMGGTSNGVDGNAGTCDDNQTYMKQVPTDSGYHYTAIPSLCTTACTDYYITADLNNRTTDDTNSLTKCGATASSTVDFAVCNE